MLLKIYATGDELKTLVAAANTEQGQILGGLVVRAAYVIDYVQKFDAEQAAQEAWIAERDATGEKFGPAWEALLEADRRLEAARIAYVRGGA